MSGNGWIKLHRKLSKNQLWTLEPFTRGQAWVDLILLANHERGYILVRGIKIDILRGQVGWSELRLSERWKWSRSKVRTFFKLLESEQQIIQQKNKISSIISIVNYNMYQGQDNKEDNKETTEGQQKDTNKKNKEEIKNISVPLKDGTFFTPDNKYLELLKNTYANINIEFEFKKIISWCISNPEKQKTKRGSKKFINGWMNRANEKITPASKTDISTESWF